jgi:hypothetical protein
MNMPRADVTMDAVRRVLKNAGLQSARTQASTLSRDVTHVTRSGFALAREQHARRATGRVLVNMLTEPSGDLVAALHASFSGASTTQTDTDLSTARCALTAAGYAVADGVGRQLIVS